MRNFAYFCLLIAISVLLLKIALKQSAPELEIVGPVVATPPPTPSVQESVEAITRRAESCIVLVTGSPSGASGFVCEVGDRKFIYADAHCLMEGRGLDFTLPDGSQLVVGGAALAVGRDVLRLTVKSDQPALGLLERVNENLRAGDIVVVPNSVKGAAVIATMQARVAGVGPNRVEITRSVQGGSGSPIIEVKSGQVVGMTFHVPENEPRAQGPSTSASALPSAIRLDGVKDWQTVNWPEVHAEAAALQKVDELTRDFSFLTTNLADGGMVTMEMNRNPTLARPIQDYIEATKYRASPIDVAQARRRMLETLSRACRKDITDLRAQLRYDYFQRQAIERQHVREELAQRLEQMRGVQPSAL